MYIKYGIEYTLKSLDGVFAFALQDSRNQDYSVYIARDPYGVRPLYMAEFNNLNLNITSKDIPNYCFASEMKSLIDLPKDYYGGAVETNIKQFTPGTCSSTFPNQACGSWIIEKNEVSYTSLPFVTITIIVILKILKNCIYYSRP